jgi:hypothetical protein
MGKGLICRRTNTPFLLQGYFDVGWVGDVDIRRSTIGYSFFFANGIVSWTSKKQRVVAL